MLLFTEIAFTLWINIIKHVFSHWGWESVGVVGPWSRPWASQFRPAGVLCSKFYARLPWLPSFVFAWVCNCRGRERGETSRGALSELVWSCMNYLWFDNYFLNQISKSYPYSTFHNTLSLFGSGSLFIHASVTETCCEEPFHHYELPSHHVINYAEKGVASELLAIVLLTIFHLPIKSDAGIVIISTSRL